VKWALPGLFNARNAAMAAVSAGLLLDAQDPTKLKLDALDKFQGVQRRQQVLVDRPDLTVIEDFGHHPTALDLTLASLRARYPRHRLVACFEPRSNTAARKVMQDAFREALKQADEVFLAPPHRADKLGEERFDSEGVAASHHGRRQERLRPGFERGLARRAHRRGEGRPFPALRHLLLERRLRRYHTGSSPPKPDLREQTQRLTGLGGVLRDLRLQGREVGKLLLGA